MTGIVAFSPFDRQPSGSRQQPARYVAGATAADHAIKAVLKSALNQGIVRTGIAYHSRRDAQFAFMIEALLAWKALPRATQEEAFKCSADQTGVPGVNNESSFRNAASTKRSEAT